MHFLYREIQGEFMNGKFSVCIQSPTVICAIILFFVTVSITLFTSVLVQNDYILLPQLCTKWSRDRLGGKPVQN